MAHKIVTAHAKKKSWTDERHIKKWKVVRKKKTWKVHE
jgi:hypothetical protein